MHSKTKAYNLNVNHHFRIPFNFFYILNIEERDIHQRKNNFKILFCRSLMTMGTEHSINCIFLFINVLHFIFFFLSFFLFECYISEIKKIFSAFFHSLAITRTPIESICNIKKKK